jgi:hypothetical protein
MVSLSFVVVADYEQFSNAKLQANLCRHRTSTKDSTVGCEFDVVPLAKYQFLAGLGSIL